jgi:hypothetical protein
VVELRRSAWIDPASAKALSVRVHNDLRLTWDIKPPKMGYPIQWLVLFGIARDRLLLLN